ncbi:TRAP transporter large permease [Microbacterium sp. NPDC055910]|uniref:TRAP transporter large permease n=1 Tax=Microbacterium sp. NPDC055910 TaxID=3345659 RepID=UPI0035E0E4B0
MTVLLMVLGLLVCLLVLRLPVYLSLLVPSIVYILLSGGKLSFSVLLQQLTSGVDSFVLLAVPMFILMGNLSNASGITDRMFDAAKAALGRVRGSLGYVNIFVSLGFSWMNGSALADVAGTGKIEIPTMIKNGYDKRFAVGLTGASALIGPIMPPSIPAVIFALTAGVSLGGMLLAGIGPAFLLTASLIVWVWVLMRKQEHLRLARIPTRQVALRLLKSLPALATPVILVGGILGGFFTPTEAAGVAVMYVFILGLVYRAFTIAKLKEVLRSSAHATAGVMIIIGSASLFAWILTVEGVQVIVGDALQTIVHEQWQFLLIVNILLIVVGTVMETTSLILILVPILMPLALSYGVDPLHFGVIVVFNLMVGLLTPPMGLLLFLLKSVTGMKMKDVILGVAQFAVPIFVCMMLLTFAPAISTTIPRLVGL